MITIAPEYIGSGTPISKNELNPIAITECQCSNWKCYRPRFYTIYDPKLHVERNIKVCNEVIRGRLAEMQIKRDYPTSYDALIVVEELICDYFNWSTITTSNRNAPTIIPNKIPIIVCERIGMIAYLDFEHVASTLFGQSTYSMKMDPRYKAFIELLFKQTSTLLQFAKYKKYQKEVDRLAKKLFPAFRGGWSKYTHEVKPNLIELVTIMLELQTQKNRIEHGR